MTYYKRMKENYKFLLSTKIYNKIIQSILKL